MDIAELFRPCRVCGEPMCDLSCELHRAFRKIQAAARALVEATEGSWVPPGARGALVKLKEALREVAEEPKDDDPG